MCAVTALILWGSVCGRRVALRGRRGLFAAIAASLMIAAHSSIGKTGGLRLGGAGQQPRHDSPVTIAATGELMFLSRFRRKGGSLLFGLSTLQG